MQLFLHILNTLIPQLSMPSYILSVSYFELKNKMAAEITENVITAWLTMNIKTSFRCLKYFFLGSGNSILMFQKVI